MKKSFKILFALLLLAMPGFAQETYKGLPVIKATANVADYKIGGELVKGTWQIMPELAPDVLQVPVHAQQEKVVFYTNLDSIVFHVQPGEKHQFYVMLNGKDYALTELQGFGFDGLKFNELQVNPSYSFTYEQNVNNIFLNTLRGKYQLDEVVKGASNDTERALRMVNWVHNQWKHNGANEPSRPDALTILEEVKDGKQFRCVEYGIVATSCLNSIGLPARVMGLKTKDVETTEYGAGHVLLEVFLPDLQKWVMLDGQFDAMPVLHNIPLNAVEFQQAIASNYDELEIRSLSGTSKAQYVNWVYPYLYYFDVRFDNREGMNIARETIKGKSSLMLVPAGAKKPKVFQVKYPMKDYLYTTSPADLYRSPEINTLQYAEPMQLSVTGF
ncbi:transglutaminase superfamily protein [Pontibacter ummariensis]|uniref:Transglutaminase-like superfamily protein n=1 Tax=Pontibacter ummariensis TaxID=1610492 RepID=A0A239HNP6_9BACT|nr:transglutaminase-like domain-containing protein [Pontibacter ummariensis]PRY10336.1 transglutaminase superfamily protein [Pontibacter ummariensis]SNS82533.1 Transglutaminase-like superfamily protein [Pontibacter ummariensis]